MSRNVMTMIYIYIALHSVQFVFMISVLFLHERLLSDSYQTEEVELRYSVNFSMALDNGKWKMEMDRGKMSSGSSIKKKNFRRKS